MSVLASAFVIGAFVVAPVFAQSQQSEDASSPRTVTIQRYDSEALEVRAKCAWSKLPVTSQNLMRFQSDPSSMPKNDGIPFATGEELLNQRIDALCGKDLPSGHTMAIGIVQRAKDRIFREAAPEEPGARDERVKAYLCAHKMDGRYVMAETGLSRPKPKRHMPGLDTDCFRILADGTLKDA